MTAAPDILAKAEDRPASVLFACTLNSVRSPMAEAIAKHFFRLDIYFESVGVEAQPVDPMAVEVMREIGLDMSGHQPKTFEELADTSFDLIVSFSPEAHHWATEMTRTTAADIEYWATENPAMAECSRHARLAMMRELRDDLMRRITERFRKPAPKV